MPSLFCLLPTGKQKEQHAKKWLQQQGFKIVAENYNCKGGEIDLIGERHQGLTFFEVKYRKSSDYGHPAEMVNLKKQPHIVHCAQLFLQKHPQYQDYGLQFDVITFTGSQQTPHWIENAFEAF